MSVGALKLGSFLILVILYGVYVVGRERRYLEAWAPMVQLGGVGPSARLVGFR